MFSIKERVFIIEQYFKTKSCNAVRNQFRGKFSKEGPTDSGISRLVKKFLRTASVERMRNKRKRTVLTSQKLNHIKESFDKNPRKSMKQRSLEENIQISQQSLRNAAKL